MVRKQRKSVASLAEHEVYTRRFLAIDDTLVLDVGPGTGDFLDLAAERIGAVAVFVATCPQRQTLNS